MDDSESHFSQCSIDFEGQSHTTLLTFFLFCFSFFLRKESRRVEWNWWKQQALKCKKVLSVLKDGLKDTDQRPLIPAVLLTVTDHGPDVYWPTPPYSCCTAQCHWPWTRCILTNAPLFLLYCSVSLTMDQMYTDQRPLIPAVLLNVTDHGPDTDQRPLIPAVLLSVTDHGPDVYWPTPPYSCCTAQCHWPWTRCILTNAPLFLLYCSVSLTMGQMYTDQRPLIPAVLLSVTDHGPDVYWPTSPYSCCTAQCHWPWARCILTNAPLFLLYCSVSLTMD